VGRGKGDAGQIRAATIELGLDKPLYIQFGKYIIGLLHGNLGYSLRTHNPVSSDLKSCLPATIELVLISTIFAIIVGIPLGVISAQKKDKMVDHLSRFFSVGAVSLPIFWVGLFLQLIFYRWLGIFPLGARLSTDTQLFYNVPHITGLLTIDSLITLNLPVFKDAVLHLVLPCITLALYPIGLSARMTRSALLEILNEDYICAARSYGLSERLVLWSYALKNSLGPTATVITMSIGYTLVNTFLVESIFSWPGIGMYISTAVMSMDYPAIMGVTMFSACAYIVLNLVADLIVSLDPRVRI
jgi:peptide/nickel transport system permease protein